MARKRKSHARKGRKRNAYSSCMSKAMKGKKMKTKTQRRKVMKAVQRKCGRLR
jgi:hypothetical protein